MAPNGSDLGDLISFGANVDEQDSPTDQLSIGVTTDGQIGVGETLDSTETLTITDNPTQPSTDTYTDFGSETLLPGSVNELDTSGESVTSDDQLLIDDNLSVTDTTTSPNGTVVTDTAGGDNSDSITDDETDILGDNHTDTGVPDNGGWNEITNNDDTFNDQSHVVDNYGQTDSASQSTVIPLPGGSATVSGGVSITQ